MEKKNIINVYTTSNGAELNISAPSTKQVISATNNRAQYFAEQAKKYRDEAKLHRDNAKYYADQNSDVSFEYIDSVRASLEDKISTKQNVGDYALKEDLPTNLSQLENDTEYVNKAELNSSIDEVRLPSMENAEGKFLATDGENEYWTGINSFQLFDTKWSDRILSYEESKGWALQGTYVYKEAIAGSRYGYPDFYAKCLEEMEAGVDETITKGGITKTIRKNPNGHRFYDIADKDLADAFLADVGACWWYGVDAENERILLPRNEWFEQATSNVNKVNNHSKAGLPNVTGTFNIDVNSNEYYSSTTWTGAFSGEQAGTQGASGDGVTSTKITFDASKSNSIYGRSTTVQPTAVKKLLYICVGNTTNYEGVTEVVNQGMELLEQVNQGVESRLDVNITNITTEGKKTIIAWGLPDYSNGIEVRFTSGGLNYTVPDNGFLTVQMLLVTNALGEIKVNGITVLRGKSGSSSYFGQLNGQIMVRKGDVITSVNAYAPTDTGVNFAIFYPLKGAN